MKCKCKNGIEYSNLVSSFFRLMFSPISLSLVGLLSLLFSPCVSSPHLVLFFHVSCFISFCLLFPPLFVYHLVSYSLISCCLIYFSSLVSFHLVLSPFLSSPPLLSSFISVILSHVLLSFILSSYLYFVVFSLSSFFHLVFLLSSLVSFLNIFILVSPLVSTCLIFHCLLSSHLLVSTFLFVSPPVLIFCCLVFFFSW